MSPQLPLNSPFDFLGSGFQWLLPLSSALSWPLLFLRCEAFTDLLGGGGSSPSKVPLPSSSDFGLGGIYPPHLLKPKSGGGPTDGSPIERRPSLSIRSSETTTPSLLVCLLLCLLWCDVSETNVVTVHNREGLSLKDVWRSVSDFDMWPLYAVSRSRNRSIRELTPTRSVWLPSLSLPLSAHTLLLHLRLCECLTLVAYQFYNLHLY